jgi:beta-N-acetylhexosaminidase
VSTTQNLANALAAGGLVTQRLSTGSPTPEVIAQAVAAARANDVTVVTTSNAWGDTTQQNLVNALLATGKPALAGVLLGANPTGRLPVTVRTATGNRVLFRFGSGLRYGSQ